MPRRTQPAIIPKSACAGRPDRLAPMPALLTLKTRLRAWLLLCATALTTAALAQTAGLPPEVDAALARAKLPRDALTVLVVDANAGNAAPRASHRAQALVNPASVMKLVTTYAALDQLGPAFTWNTPVYLDGKLQDGTFTGNVYIKGQGDPTLVMERLWLLLRRLQGLGIQTIAGDIVLDRSAFAPSTHNPAEFDGEPTRPYNAAADALLVNFKSVVMRFTPDPAAGLARVAFDPPLARMQLQASVPLAAAGAGCNDYRAGLKAELANPDQIRFDGVYPAACGERVWPVAYADPAAYAARAIEGMWRASGGQLTGRVRDGQVPATLKPAFSASSPPLAEVVRDINKFSNNVMAQQVFLTLSLQNKGLGSTDASRELLRQWWQTRISPSDAPVVDSGSGLSRESRLNAQGLARMLQVAWASPLMPELMASLPITGVDGTLRRIQGGATGAAHLKSGSLRDVWGVAGYVHGASGKRYVLVAIANHPNAAAVRPAVEALVDWTARDR